MAAPLDPEPVPPDEVPEVLPVRRAASSEDRTLGLLCHLGGFLTWIAAPLVIWLIKKE